MVYLPSSVDLLPNLLLPNNLNNLNIKQLLNINLNNSKPHLNPLEMLVKLMPRLSLTVLKLATMISLHVNGTLKPSSLVNKWLPTTKLFIYTFYNLFFFLFFSLIFHRRYIYIDNKIGIK